MTRRTRCAKWRFIATTAVTRSAPRAASPTCRRGCCPTPATARETHLLAVQMYAWGYATYRRTGTALGVASLTAWRWVSAWGADLLPIAALFGVVKSSGVVGVDEKYVLVPKNDKPAGKMRRWMYVYLAVDVWTYDLLHIAIYPNNDQASADSLPAGLAGQGLPPTGHRHRPAPGLWPGDRPGLPAGRASLNASSMPCSRHNGMSRTPTARTMPSNIQKPRSLKQQIYAIFDAETLALATERYTAVAGPALRLRPSPARGRGHLRLSGAPLAQAGQ